MPDPKNEFEEASKQKQGSLLSEFLSFLGENKKFWLLPIIIVMLALAGLLVLTSTSLAPFIYTLF